MIKGLIGTIVHLLGLLVIVYGAVVGIIGIFKFAKKNKGNVKEAAKVRATELTDTSIEKLTKAVDQLNDNTLKAWNWTKEEWNKGKERKAEQQS